MHPENKDLFYQMMLEFDWSKLHSLDFDEVEAARHELYTLHNTAKTIPDCEPIFYSFLNDPNR